MRKNILLIVAILFLFPLAEADSITAVTPVAPDLQVGSSLAINVKVTNPGNQTDFFVKLIIQNTQYLQLIGKDSYLLTLVSGTSNAIDFQVYGLAPATSPQFLTV